MQFVIFFVFFQKFCSQNYKNDYQFDADVASCQWETVARSRLHADHAISP
jgi:hypothetical protein